MTKYKYEKVEGMTVGKVIDAALDGEQFYRNQTIEEQRFNFEKIDIFTLHNWIKRGCVYRKIEDPWWKKHVGGLVMFSDHENRWISRVFSEYRGDANFPFVDSLGTGWKQNAPTNPRGKRRDYYGGVMS